MEIKALISLVLLIILVTNEFGGVMIVQGRSGAGGGGSSHSSSSHSGSSHSSSHSSSSHISSSGHVYTKPILTRNYGGYSGRQSTSNSGFGLGEFLFHSLSVRIFDKKTSLSNPQLFHSGKSL